MAGPVADLKVQLDIESAKFRKEISRVVNQLDVLGNKIESSSRKMGASAGEVFKGVAAWEMLAGAVRSAGDWLMGGVHALAESEQASLRLSSALRTLGYDAEALLAPLEAQQRMFERQTLFAGDTVAQIQQLLLQYGAAPSMIERTTRAILDYAAAEGKDAVTATRTLMQAVSQGKDGIASLGLAYKSTGDTAKDLETVVDRLSTKFGGTAEAASQGLAGKLDNLKTASDDLAKSFGGFLATVEEKLGIVQLMINALDQLRISLGGATDEEAQHERQHRINELLKEREEFEEKLNNPILYARARNEIRKINEEIRRLQKESAEYLKRPGVVHSNVLGGGSTFIPPDLGKGKICPVPKCGLPLGHPGPHANQDKPKPNIDLRGPGDIGWRARQGMVEFIEIAPIPFNVMREEAEKLTESLRTPIEVLSAETANLNKLWNAGVLDAETYNRALAEANRRYRDAAAELDLVGQALGRLSERGFGFLGRIGDVLMAPGGALSKDLSTAAQSKLGMSAGAADPLGALLAVFAEIIVDSESFRVLTELAADVIKALADSLGPIIDPVNRVIAALVPFADALGELHAPIGMLVDTVLRPFVPVIIMLAHTMQALTPAVQMLVGALLPIVDLLMVPTSAALYALFSALKFVSLGMLEVASLIGPMWNNMLSAIRSVFKSLADWEVAGIKPFAFLADWVKTLQSATIPLAEIEQQKQDLLALDWEMAQARADEIVATKDLTEAAKEAASALFNLPAGYKIAGALFAAAVAHDALSVPAFAEGGVVSKATLALVGEGGEREVIAPESMLRRVIREEGGRDVRIQVLLDGRELHAAIRRYQAREHYQLTGELYVPGA